jgi:hypothetical protein
MKASGYCLIPVRTVMPPTGWKVTHFGVVQLPHGGG